MRQHPIWRPGRRRAPNWPVIVILALLGLALALRAAKRANDAQERQDAAANGITVEALREMRR